MVIESQLLNDCWIQEEELDSDNWIPAFYSHDFLQVAKEIRENYGDYQELATFVTVAKVQRADKAPGVGWIARIREGRLAIDSIPANAEAVLENFSCFPAEAILVAISGTGDVQIGHWDESVYGAKCVGHPSILVFESGDGKSIAWLVEELGSLYCKLQIRRRISGAVVPAVAPADVLGVFVKRRRIEDRQSSAALYRRQAELEFEHRRMVALMRRRQLASDAIRSGASFEERRELFEQLLVSTEAPVEPLAFVEASTSDPQSDFFLVRALKAQDSSDELPFTVASSDQDAKQWCEWYWGGLGSDYRLFHVLSTSPSPCLPAFIMRRLVAALAGETVRLLASQTGREGGRKSVPVLGFEQFSEICRGTILRDGIEGLIDSQELLQSLALTTGAESVDPAGEADQTLSFYRNLYRPVLALRVRREGKPVGVYLVTTKGPLEDVQAEAALDTLGADLAASLAPSPAILEESNRRESLRRLSWLMHQLNGPLGRAASALEHVDEFLSSRQDVAELLVPSEEEARKMSRMNDDEPLSEYHLVSRLGVVKRAFGDIKKVTYQIRRLRRAQSAGSRANVNIAHLLQECVTRTREQLPALQIHSDLSADTDVLADHQMLVEALEEVLSNCLRELEMQQVAQPILSIGCKHEGNTVSIQISDNALPVEAALINDPFEEDASMYAQFNKGSGLGLTIVRETFRSHGGVCNLEKNHDASGAPCAGVVFKASIPARPTN